MTQISQPDVTVNIVGANEAVANSDHQVLFVGQQTSGSATSGDLQQNIQDDNSWDTLFGANSQLAGMIRDFRAINKATQIDAIGLDDNGSGVAATGNVTFTGTATEDGELEIIVGSERNFSFTIAVSDTDTATDVGAALETALNANANLPVTAANTTADRDWET